jgi:hypothetical protein
MVTRKATVNPRFVFKKEWVFDPVPPWLKLDRATLTKIKQLKTDFTKQVNEALEAAQKNVKPGG